MFIGAAGSAGAAAAAAGAAAGAGAGAAASATRESASSRTDVLQSLFSQNRIVHAQDAMRPLLLSMTHLQSEGRSFPRELIELIHDYASVKYTKASSVSCKGVMNGGLGFTFSRDPAGGLMMGVLHAGGQFFSRYSLERDSGEPLRTCLMTPPKPGEEIGLSRLALTPRGFFSSLLDQDSATKFLRYDDSEYRCPNVDLLSEEERGWGPRWACVGLPCEAIGAYTYDPQTTSLLTLHEERQTGMTVTLDQVQRRDRRYYLLFSGKMVLAALGIDSSTIFAVSKAGIWKAVGAFTTEERKAQGLEVRDTPEEEVVKGGFRAATADHSRFVMQSEDGAVSVYHPGPNLLTRAFQTDFRADFMATNRYGTVALLPRDATRCSLWDLEAGIPILTLHPNWGFATVSQGVALSDSYLCVQYRELDAEDKPSERVQRVAIYDLRAPAKPIAHPSTT